MSPHQRALAMAALPLALLSTALLQADGSAADRPASADLRKPIAAAFAPAVARSTGGPALVRAGGTQSADQGAPRLVPALPASLQGTEGDGSLEVDGQGHLVAGPGVRRFFDYFLTAEGEEPDAAIRARIVAAARARLPAKAAAELESLLADYLRYRAAGGALRDVPGDPEAARARLADLRRDSFGPAIAAALFADDDALVDLALERRRLDADARLTPAERAARERALEAQLPPALREARDKTSEPARLDAEEAAMRAAGAADDEIAAVRTQASGPEAAARLAELDRQRQDWSARLQAFRERRAALEAAGIDPAEREQKVQSLLAELFTATERLRVEAIERGRL